MTEIYLNHSEWYPVYEFSRKRFSANETETEVSPDDLERLERAFSEFEWAQDFLDCRFDWKAALGR